MKEEKVKVNLRVGLLIRETLVDEAAVEDIRVGTLANRLLQSEMDKVMKVGADNCLIMNSREYLASEAEIEQNRAAYYLFPETKVVSRFIATQLDDKIYPQISFYFLISYFIDNGTDAAILRTEVMTPFRNTMGFVHGIERNLHRFQKLHILFLRQ